MSTDDIEFLRQAVAEIAPPRDNNREEATARVEVMMEVLNVFGRALQRPIESKKAVLPKMQAAVLDSGLGEALCEIFTNPRGQCFLDERENSLHCLKFVVIDNTNACSWVLRRQGMVDAMKTVIEDAIKNKEDMTEAQTEFYEANIRLINTISRTLWSAHAQLIASFCSLLATLVRDPIHDARLRVQCVNYFMIVSCNPVVSQQLRPALNDLTAIALLSDHDLNPIGAILAVSNICHPHSLHANTNDNGNNNPDDSGNIANDDGNSNNANGEGSGSGNNDGGGEAASGMVFEHSAGAEHIVTGEAIQMLKAALARSLKNEDYPPGSRRFYTDWMLCLGVANLCSSQDGLLALKQVGIESILKRANESSDLRVRQHASRALASLATVAGPSILPPDMQKAVNKMKGISLRSKSSPAVKNNDNDNDNKNNNTTQTKPSEISKASKRFSFANIHTEFVKRTSFASKLKGQDKNLLTGGGVDQEYDTGHLDLEGSDNDNHTSSPVNTGRSKVVFS